MQTFNRLSQTSQFLLDPLQSHRLDHLILLLPSLHRVNNHGNEQVQDRERRNQYVSDKKHSSIGVRLFDFAHDVGPALKRHDLEQAEHRDMKIAEPVRIGLSKEL